MPRAPWSNDSQTRIVRARADRTIQFLESIALWWMADWSRGCSSVGRAAALQAVGREFESPQLHQRALSSCGSAGQLSASPNWRGLGRVMVPRACGAQAGV